MSRLDEFRAFVNKYPKIKEEVQSGKRSWQSIYEDFVILGVDSDVWNKFKNEPSLDFLNTDTLKNVLGYIKKINPDSISKTLNTVQKVLQISESFTNRTGLYNANYNSWWD